MPNFTMAPFYRINVVVLWAQRKSNYKVSLLSAWVGIYACKQRHAKSFGNSDVARGLERHIRYSKAIGVGIKTCGIGTTPAAAVQSHPARRNGTLSSA